MHITADDIKLIHDFGWAIIPYGVMIMLLGFLMNSTIALRKEIINA